MILVNAHKLSSRIRKLKFAYWTIPESGRRKTKKLYTIEPTKTFLEFQDYCVKGEYVLLKYKTLAGCFDSKTFEIVKIQEELWRMVDPTPTPINLPNVDLFCRENESIDKMINGGGWLFDTNKNSQFLVKACMAKMQTDKAKMEYFVVVFGGFDDPEYLRWINITAYRSFQLHLTVVGENKDAKTLLMVERVPYHSTVQPEIGYDPVEGESLLNEFGGQQEMRGFDLATGEELFIWGYGKHSSFVPSRKTVWFDLLERDCLAKLLWINWNGKKLRISESDVPLPVNRVKTTIRAVTDTRILWEVAGESQLLYFV